MVPSTKEIIRTVRKMEMDVSLLLTEAITPDSSKTMKFQVWVNTSGLMEKCTRDNGKRTKCMVREL